MEHFEFDLKNISDEILVNVDSEYEIRLIASGDEVIKRSILFRHVLKDIKSRIRIKIVCFDNARADIEAKVLIENGAKGTDTYLKIDGLMIGENSFIRAIPSLEIKENEVKGGHGATIGRIDEDTLFYMGSRGMKEAEVEEEVVRAFIK